MTTPFLPFTRKLSAAGFLLLASHALGQAVDFPALLDNVGLIWTAKPAGRFSTTSAADAHDGSDAVQFSVPTSQTAVSLQTTVEGPAVVSW